MSARAPLVTMAMFWVAQHAVDHGLAVAAIEEPRLKGDPIAVRIQADHFEAWLDTVTNLGPAERREIRDTDSDRLWHTARVPSPLGGVHVELWTVVRRSPVGLHLVTGPAS